MWQKDININEIREIRVKTTAFLGVGAISKIDFIAGELVKRGINKVIVISGRNAYKKTGAWDVVVKALDNHKITYVQYDKVTPNPEVKHVDEATKIARDFGAEAVISIGGGSAIDAGKIVAALLEYPDKNATELVDLSFPIEKAAPIIAINLTHGTGTEVDRFSVVTIPEKNYKPAIAADPLYPLYAIDDPALMVSLPLNQTTYVSVDAVNHVVEACSTTATNPFAIMIAQETVKLVAEYLPAVQKNLNDLEGRYYLTYASMMAGTAFDNGLLHMTHALEHPLSGIKSDLTHGLGLAILLPSVVKNIYDTKKNTLFSVLKPILGDLKFESATSDDVAKAVKNWLVSVGIKESLKDLGFNESHLDKLTQLAFDTPGLAGLLAIAPVKADAEMVRKIYEESL
jgi:alcohol dehydrogenase class IV